MHFFLKSGRMAAFVLSCFRIKIQSICPSHFFKPGIKKDLHLQVLFCLSIKMLSTGFPAVVFSVQIGKLLVGVYDYLGDFACWKNIDGCF